MFWENHLHSPNNDSMADASILLFLLPLSINVITHFFLHQPIRKTTAALLLLSLFKPLFSSSQL